MRIAKLWIATLTRAFPGGGDSGTDSRLDLSVEVSGREVFRARLPQGSGGNQENGRANVYSLSTDNLDLEISELTNSSVRIELEGNDAWNPECVFVWAEALRSLLPRPFIFPIAMETNSNAVLSTDSEEGTSSIPLRLVQRGDSNTTINRLLLLVSNIHIDDDVSTDPNPEYIKGKLVVQITTADKLLVLTELGHTYQGDLGNGRSNYYQPHVLFPFTKRQLDEHSIVISKREGKAWHPTNLFLFGLNTKFSRPTRVVPLVYLPDLRRDPTLPLRIDNTTGEIYVPLPLVNEGFDLPGGDNSELSLPNV